MSILQLAAALVTNSAQDGIHKRDDVGIAVSSDSAAES